MDNAIPNSSDRDLKRYQFSLRSLLIATTVIAIFVSYFVNYGGDYAITAGVLSSLAWFWFIRAIRWKRHTFWQHLFSIIGGGIIFTVLISFIVGVEVNPFIARVRNARYLQRVLNADTRFSAIQVKYSQGYEYLSVHGHVHSERELKDLRGLIRRYEWGYGIEWNVSTDSPKHHYYGSDEMLFGEQLNPVN